MASIDDELLKDAEEDALIVDYIKAYLPQELKTAFSDEDLYYFLDVIVEYYATSGILEQETDEEGCVDVDVEEIARYVVKKAEAEGIGTFKVDDVVFVVEAELEYTENIEDDEE